MVAVAAAIGTATTVPYIGVAAFVAAPNNIINNIACMIQGNIYIYDIDGGYGVDDEYGVDGGCGVYVGYGVDGSYVPDVWILG